MLVQNIGQETLVYSEALHQAFCLNPIAAQVWGLLDGIRTPDEIAAAVTATLCMPVTEQVVLLAISELQRDGLVMAQETSAGALVAPSRRDMMRQMGVGALLTLPVVATIMAPTAAQAYTGCLNCNVVPGPVNSMLKQQQQTFVQQQAAAMAAAANNTQVHDDQGGLGNPTLVK